MPSEPLAYLITFRTYGTWLHGDERGSTDRDHNVPGTPLLDADPARRSRERTRLQTSPVVLNADQRTVIRQTIQDVVAWRGWTVRAIEVRSNHVHIVISAPDMPERVMNSLKSWCTRRMVEAGCLPTSVRPWSRHGSTRYLWRPHEVDGACRYVSEAQGGDL